MQFYVHYIDKDDRNLKTETHAQSYEELKINLLKQGADIISIKDIQGIELYLPKLTNSVLCNVPMGINPNDNASIEQLALAQMNGQSTSTETFPSSTSVLSAPLPPTLAQPVQSQLGNNAEEYLFYNMGTTRVRVIKKTGQLQKREWLALTPEDIIDTDIELAIKQKDGTFINVKEMKDIYISKWVNV